MNAAVTAPDPLLPKLRLRADGIAGNPFWGGISRIREKNRSKSQQDNR